MRVCYICGRQFGSSSLSIHEPQCMKKWEAQQDLLPPEQRRPRPVRPEVVETVQAGGAARSEIEAQNEAAYRSYDSNLSPCPNCGRTFNPDLSFDIEVFRFFFPIKVREVLIKLRIVHRQIAPLETP